MTTPTKLMYLIACALPACSGGTDVGNPVDLGVSGYRTSSAARAMGQANGNIDVESAWLALDRVDFQPEGTCDLEESDVEVEVAVGVNLLSSELPSLLRDLPIGGQRFCRLRLRWHKLPGPLAGAPADFVNTSIYVGGTRGDGTRFVIRSDRNDRLSLRARGQAFSISDADNAVFLGVDLQAWLLGVNLDGAVVGADGVIHVDDDANKALLDVFESNIERGSKLFLDNNGNGRLDDTERDESDAIADGAP